MKIKTFLLSIAWLLATSLGAQATTYYVDRTIGAGTVTGFVETDGTIGVLSNGNILDWAFTLTSPSLSGGSPDFIESATQLYTQISTGLSATLTELLFDFSASGFTYFQGGSYNGWCLTDAGSGCGSVGSGVGEQIFWGTGTSAAEYAPRSGVVTVGTATVSPVPLPASLPLLLAGIGGLAAFRRRSKAA